MDTQQLTKNSVEAQIEGKETAHKVVVREGPKEP
jgi:hypothetical protein